MSQWKNLTFDSFIVSLTNEISANAISFITHYDNYEIHSSSFEKIIIQHQLDLTTRMIALIGTVVNLIPLIVIVSSHSRSSIEIGSIPVDTKGRPLEKKVDECGYVRTIGVFDLIDCPMDGKQILGVFQHILCEYAYDQNQMNQINVCIRLAVSRYFVNLLIN